MNTKELIQLLRNKTLTRQERWPFDDRDFEIKGDELALITAPTTPREYFTKYFGKRSFHSRTKKDRFAKIFSIERFRRALLLAEETKDSAVTVVAGFDREGIEENRVAFPVRYNQISHLLEEGATVCVSNIHLMDPILSRYAYAFQTQLNIPGTVGFHCYLSSNHCGFNMHFDARIASTLQIGGSKIWRFSKRPAIDWPLDNFLPKMGEGTVDVTYGEIRSEDIEEITLEEGDFLSLPAGTWHAAKAQSYSLALNLFVQPINFSRFISRALEPLASEKTEWRAGMPSVFGDLEEKMPNEVSNYIDLRLEEAEKNIKELRKDRVRIHSLWLDTLVNSTKGFPFETQPKKTEETITKTTRLSVSNLRPMRILKGKEKNKAYLKVYFGSQSATFDSRLLPFFKKLKSMNNFQAKDALTWAGKDLEFDWNTFLVVLKKLEEIGLIRIANKKNTIAKL